MSRGLLKGASLIAALLAFPCGGCGDDKGDRLPFPPAGEDAAPAPMEPGPFPVGVTTVDYVDEERPADMRFLLNQVEKAGGGASALLAGAVDPARVGAAGHSFGGFTATAAACLDARVRLAVLLAPLPRLPADASCSLAEFPVPLLLMGGTEDRTIAWREQYCMISHTCGIMAQTFDPRLRPGNSTVTEHLSFVSRGECEYDAAGTTLTGVVHGPTGISCTVSTEPDGMGGTVVVMATGVATSYGDYMLGTARAYLFDLPMGTPDCSADYNMRFDRE